MVLEEAETKEEAAGQPEVLEVRRVLGLYALLLAEKVIMHMEVLVDLVAVQVAMGVMMVETGDQMDRTEKSTPRMDITPGQGKGARHAPGVQLLEHYIQEAEAVER